MKIHFERTTDETGEYVRATADHPGIFSVHPPIVGEWMRSKSAALRSLARAISIRVDRVPRALLRLAGSREDVEES